MTVPAFAGAVAMALGVYAGATAESEGDDDVVADAADVYEAPTIDEGADDGWEELAELAFAENLGLEP